MSLFYCLCYTKIIMFNESKSHNSYNYGDYKEEIQKSTPQGADFIDCPVNDKSPYNDDYSEEGIQKDEDRIKRIKIQCGIRKDPNSLKESEIQEYAVTDELVTGDWFREETRAKELYPDGNGDPCTANLSSEYDDFVNHIDVICTINNAETGYKTIPFALDLTFNTDNEKLDKKFSYGWRDPKTGYKYAGLATAKYYEDTAESLVDDPLPKGRIPVMPRFVIGFSTELSDQMAKNFLGAPGDEWSILNDDEENKRLKKSERACWMVLDELCKQANELVNYLETVKDDGPLIMGAYENAIMIRNYIDGAWEDFGKVREQNQAADPMIDYDEAYIKIMSRSLVPNVAEKVAS